MYGWLHRSSLVEHKQRVHPHPRAHTYARAHSHKARRVYCLGCSHCWVSQCPCGSQVFSTVFAYHNQLLSQLRPSGRFESGGGSSSSGDKAFFTLPYLTIEAAVKNCHTSTAWLTLQAWMVPSMASSQERLQGTGQLTGECCGTEERFLPVCCPVA